MKDSMARSVCQIVLSCYLSLLIALFPRASTQQGPRFDLNPVDNFCSRWWAQSIVKDNVLFIDSGLQKWNGSDIPTPALGINNYILTIPLDRTWDWKTNIVINAEPKNETNPATGTRPLSLMRGHLFHGPANVSNVYVYGGTSYMGNRTFQTYAQPDSSTYPLWTYDYNTTDYPWSQHDISQPWMANHGAATEAVDQGLGYYLNGQIDWGTSTKTLRLNNEDEYGPLEGMLVINFYDQTSKNISTSGIQSDAPRVGGSLDYLADVGGMGALVAIGGHINDDSLWVNASKGSLLNLSRIDVFDIDSYLSNPETNGTWYQQATDGDIPEPRIDFCTVTMSAPDNSSHHIYLYGGRDPIKGVAYDDVYVLTIPSFTWTAIFTDGGAPRWGHNCHLVGKRQMVTVGGNITDTLTCDWELKGVAFLDMTTVTWGSVYLTNTSAYGVPLKARPFTGGTAEGNATVKEPAKGWTDEKLQAVFATPRKWGSLSTNITDPGAPEAKKESSNTGAIAGGVIGGLAGLVLLAGAFYFLKRRRDKARKPHELSGNEIYRGELGEKIDEKHELQGVNENDPAELPGPDAHELNAPRNMVEADQTTSTNAAELSGENVVAGGNPGVPFLRTPGDDLPTPPLYSPGLSPPATSPSQPTTPPHDQPKEGPK